MTSNIEPLPTGVLRNCCRCGNEFAADAKGRVCPSCRKPMAVKHEPLRRHLTFREKQIVDLVIQAKLNKEIAYELHLSEGTVKEYLHKVFRKLGVKTRTELAVWALVSADGSRVIEPDSPQCSASAELFGEPRQSDSGHTCAIRTVN
jgi:DNA-binding CsgD family transcriptional regulator